MGVIVRDIYVRYSVAYDIKQVISIYKYSIEQWSSYIKQAEYAAEDNAWYKSMVIFYTDLFDFVSKYYNGQNS